MSPVAWWPPRQVFHHLGELDEALFYALGAGKLFDINEQSEYVQTTLGEHSQSACVLCSCSGLGGSEVGSKTPSSCACPDRCIDQYVELRSRPAEGNVEAVDERLVAIVERLFERCGRRAGASAAALCQRVAALACAATKEYIEHTVLHALPCGPTCTHACSRFRHRQTGAGSRRHGATLSRS